jgi:hypothetical protein
MWDLWWTKWLRFPPPILIPSNVPYLSNIRGWYNRPISGERAKWAQSHPTPRKIKNLRLCLNSCCFAGVGGGGVLLEQRTGLSLVQSHGQLHMFMIFIILHVCISYTWSDLVKSPSHSQIREYIEFIISQEYEDAWQYCRHVYRNSSVGIATGYGLDDLGSTPSSARFFSYPQRSDRLWGPTSPLFNGYRDLFRRS